MTRARLMSLGLAGAVMLGAGSCEAGVDPCAGEITDGNVYVELTMPHTYTLDRCGKRIPIEHYAWMRLGETAPLTIRFFSSSWQPLTPKTVDFVMDFGGTINAARNFTPTERDAKLMVQVDSVYYSNFLYIAVLDPIREWSIPGYGAKYSISGAATETPWSVSGTLVVDDTGEPLRYEQCVGNKPSDDCTPHVPVRHSLASFTGTLCHADGTCAPEALVGRAWIDTLKQVELCLVQGTQLPPVGQSRCYLDTYLSTLHLKPDSLVGYLSGTFCTAGRKCDGGPVVAVRKQP